MIETKRYAQKAAAAVMLEEEAAAMLEDKSAAMLEKSTAIRWR